MLHYTWAMCVLHIISLLFDAQFASRQNREEENKTREKEQKNEIYAPAQHKTRREVEKNTTHHMEINMTNTK